MAQPLAASGAAVSSSSPLFSSSSSRPIARRHAPPSYVSMRTRRRRQPAAAEAAAAAEPSGSPLLEVRGLTASVKETGQQILAGVDLTIREGEIHAIMGKNGSGKSTLTKVLVGHPHYEVTGGTILFKGEDLVDMEPEDRSLAGLFMSFQAPIEIPGVSNFDFLLMAVNARREKSGLPALGPLEFYSVVSPKVDALKMDPKFLDRNVNEGFSGGERKRNEILQLSVIGADLALLDEIDSGLDVDALEDVANAVNGLLTPQNSVLMITHYQRLLDLIKPSYVHIMSGSTVKPMMSNIAAWLMLLALLPHLFFIDAAAGRQQCFWPGQAPEDAGCLSWRVMVEANNARGWRTVPAQCVGYVKGYMTRGQYLRDLAGVMEQASNYVDQITADEDANADGLDAWVFDIDDTCLSNLPYYETKQFGYGTAAASLVMLSISLSLPITSEEDSEMCASLFYRAYDPLAFKAWASKEACPGIPPVLALFTALLDKGFKVFLLSGRDEETLGPCTAGNLEAEGFSGYERLIMRSPEYRGQSSSVFKSAMRKQLVDEGYRIRGNVGDQWSDLQGDCVGDRVFKIPNPMYFVP
nr:unnamed protein product [Digitaria exilis]